jgi:outer membrane protein
VGRLTLDFVTPQSERYDPEVHYQQVRDVWWGTQVPSGR